MRTSSRRARIDRRCRAGGGAYVASAPHVRASRAARITCAHRVRAQFVDFRALYPCSLGLSYRYGSTIWPCALAYYGSLAPSLAHPRCAPPGFTSPARSPPPRLVLRTTSALLPPPLPLCRRQRRRVDCLRRATSGHQCRRRRAPRRSVALARVHPPRGSLAFACSGMRRPRALRIFEPPHHPATGKRDGTPPLESPVARNAAHSGAGNGGVRLQIRAGAFRGVAWWAGPIEPPCRASSVTCKHLLERPSARRALPKSASPCLRCSGCSSWYRAGRREVPSARAEFPRF